MRESDSPFLAKSSNYRLFLFVSRGFKRVEDLSLIIVRLLRGGRDRRWRLTGTGNWSLWHARALDYFFPSLLGLDFGLYFNRGLAPVDASVVLSRYLLIPNRPRATLNGERFDLFLTNWSWNGLFDRSRDRSGTLNWRWRLFWLDLFRRWCETTRGWFTCTPRVVTRLELARLLLWRRWG